MHSLNAPALWFPTPTLKSGTAFSSALQSEHCVSCLHGVQMNISPLLHPQMPARFCPFCDVSGSIEYVSHMSQGRSS